MIKTTKVKKHNFLYLIIEENASESEQPVILWFGAWIVIIFVSQKAIVLYLLCLPMWIMTLHWFAAGSVEVALFCLDGCHRLTCERSCFAVSSPEPP